MMTKIDNNSKDNVFRSNLTEAFKVIDITKKDDKTQITLMVYHIYREAFFKNHITDFENQLISKAHELFEESFNLNFYPNSNILPHLLDFKAVGLLETVDKYKLYSRDAMMAYLHILSRLCEKRGLNNVIKIMDVIDVSAVITKYYGYLNEFNNKNINTSDDEFNEFFIDCINKLTFIVEESYNCYNGDTKYDNALNIVLASSVGGSIIDEKYIKLNNSSKNKDNVTKTKNKKTIPKRRLSFVLDNYEANIFLSNVAKSFVNHEPNYNSNNPVNTEEEVYINSYVEKQMGNCSVAYKDINLSQNELGIYNVGDFLYHPNSVYLWDKVKAGFNKDCRILVFSNLIVDTPVMYDLNKSDGKIIKSTIPCGSYKIIDIYSKGNKTQVTLLMYDLGMETIVKDHKLKFEGSLIKKSRNLFKKAYKKNTSSELFNNECLNEFYFNDVTGVNDYEEDDLSLFNKDTILCLAYLMGVMEYEEDHDYIMDIIQVVDLRNWAYELTSHIDFIKRYTKEYSFDTYQLYEFLFLVADACAHMKIENKEKYSLNNLPNNCGITFYDDNENELFPWIKNYDGNELYSFLYFFIGKNKFKAGIKGYGDVRIKKLFSKDEKDVVKFLKDHKQELSDLLNNKILDIINDLKSKPFDEKELNNSIDLVKEYFIK